VSGGGIVNQPTLLAVPFVVDFSLVCRIMWIEQQRCTTFLAGDQTDRSLAARQSLST
jgi:hypothetical protein